MGNVLQAGEGQAPTRQALLGAGTTAVQKRANTHTRELRTASSWFNLRTITAAKMFR